MRRYQAGRNFAQCRCNRGIIALRTPNLTDDRLSFLEKELMGLGSCAMLNRAPVRATLPRVAERHAKSMRSRKQTQCRVDPDLTAPRYIVKLNFCVTQAVPMKRCPT